MRTRLIDLLTMTILVAFGFIWAIGFVLSPIWAIVYVLFDYNYLNTLGTVIVFVDAKMSRLL